MYGGTEYMCNMCICPGDPVFDYDLLGGDVVPFAWDATLQSNTKSSATSPILLCFQGSRNRRDRLTSPDVLRSLSRPVQHH